VGTQVAMGPQLKLKDRYGTISVYTRNHIGNCELTDPNDNGCSCPKWIYANRKGHKPKRYAAETPSYAEACAIAKHEHDGWHPEIAAARTAIAKRERTQKRIVDAVSEFIAEREPNDKAVIRNRDQNRSTLGYVDNKTGEVRGHFLTWLEDINRTLGDERIEYMDQLDHALIGNFKKWVMKKLNSDLTRNILWSRVRGFFRWAHELGLVTADPASKHKADQPQKGNRCGAFSDQQFEDILAAIPIFAREVFRGERLRRSDPFRAVLEQRLTIFVLLLRYAGMAMIDGIIFCPFLNTDGLGLQDNGVLKYRRHKTKELAVLPIENERLLELIRAGIPLEPDSDPQYPFSPRNFNPSNQRQSDSVTARWASRLKGLYKVAGITQIKTEVGVKNPHSHMFRDTFARWHLKRRTDIRHLSKMLGHASVQTTEASYSSWLDEDQQAMIDSILGRISESSRIAV
jgi:integrase